MWPLATSSGGNVTGTVSMSERTPCLPAVIQKDGVREEVAVELVDVQVGDRVLCHAGVALERL